VNTTKQFRFGGFLPLAVLILLAAGIGLAADKPARKERQSKTPEVLWGDFVETNFPFVSSVLDARRADAGSPTDNLTPRGIILNLGNDCWACFDTDLLRMSAIWTGKGVSPVSMAQGSYHSPGEKAPEGQEKLPQILGTTWLSNGIYPGWQVGEQLSLVDPREPGPDPKEVGRGPIFAGSGQFKAIRLTAKGACLEYEVGGVGVKECVTSRLEQGEWVIQRWFRLQRVPQALWLALGGKGPSVAANLNVIVNDRRNSQGAVQRVDSQGLLAVRVGPSAEPVEFQVAMGLSASVRTWDLAEQEVAKPSSPRWPQSVGTHGTVSSAKDAYVIDDIALPVNNPWKRNVRLADLAFFPDGRAAGITFDGDVWMITGLRGDLTNVEWRRFASGLHEPLSLGIRGGDLFVFDRNGIWRLRDADGNGEADVHELVSNAFAQTSETREYANGMKIAPDGAFIIAKGGQQGSTLGKQNGTVLRISADGKSTTVLGRGLRQPFIGVHPRTGLVTASDQQGHYVPATPLHIVRDGQFYGFLSNLEPKEKYPAPIADPLTWIPHAINASGADQVWLTDAKMGPLNNALIHLGYYRPEIFLVLLSERASRLQAAVVSLTRDLEFAPLSGAVNPVDGQLYVTGFQIWGSTANRISGLARVRYTGAPGTFPRELVPMDKGILLRFDVPLDGKKAIDPGNFSAERWNYVRTANYGSPHFKLDGSKGQEAMTPSSAYLSQDGKSLFIGIPDMKRVMQMRIGWSLATRDGTSFQQNAYFTPYELARFDPVAEGFQTLTVDLTPRAAKTQLATPVTVEEGRRVAELMGCVACHSVDGSTVGKVGPTWKGLFASRRVFQDGTKTIANEDYLRESIREPAKRVITGFEKSDTGMPSYEGVISDAQIEALVLYIKTLK